MTTVQWSSQSMDLPEFLRPGCILMAGLASQSRHVFVMRLANSSTARPDRQAPDVGKKSQIY